MAKYLIDLDVYIDFLQSGRFHNDIARLYAEHTPGLSFSSVVIEELLAGALSPDERQHVRLLYTPFERAQRIVAPSSRHRQSSRPDLSRAAFVPLKAAPLGCGLFDCSECESRWTGVYTTNRVDFELIQHSRHFSLAVLE